MPRGWANLRLATLKCPARQKTGRTVRVTPSAQMDTMFLRMSAVDHLDMIAPAAAVEGTGIATKIEIVMVLDASGSMGVVHVHRQHPAGRDETGCKILSRTKF